MDSTSRYGSFDDEGFYDPFTGFHNFRQTYQPEVTLYNRRGYYEAEPTCKMTTLVETAKQGRTWGDPRRTSATELTRVGQQREQARRENLGFKKRKAPKRRA